MPKMTIRPLLLVFCALLTRHAGAVNQIVPLSNLRIELSPAWKVVQMAASGDEEILNLVNGSDSVTLFFKPHTGLKITGFISADAKTVQAPSRTLIADLEWERVLTSKKAAAPASGTVFVSHFLIEAQGGTYHGFSRSSTESSALDNANKILEGTSLIVPLLTPFSLTDKFYSGKKYYLGWGAAGSGDPSMMQNEVKYDVLHTNAVFTTELGGNYIDNKLIGYSDATAKAVRSSWKDIGSAMKADDMYLQYSSGHGSESGLRIGVSYEEIRDNALSYPAREVVIFIMACHSGALVDAFNSVRSEWQDWPSKGRSLLVMASSDVATKSSTGPGTDPDEPSGPNGSAGSAFGHALWKALTGAADGFSDGVIDGYISLGEIRDYSRFRTKQVGGHTPVDTGAYFPSVVMNRVPSSKLLSTLNGGTENLSDSQIEDSIRKLDAELGVQPAHASW